MVTTTDQRIAVRRGSRRALPRLRSVHILPVVLQTLIWAGAGAILMLWWSDTRSIADAGDWATGAGRITGLLAGYACAVLLLLMARIPVLEKVIGGDRLARWHAMGGRYTVSLTVAHVVLILVGYSLATHTGLVYQTVAIIGSYPEMLGATIGFLLLLFTGIVSARAARRRLRYETWYYLHFLTYLAIFLAFGHQLANGADFIGDPAARAAWYALYLGVATVLVWFRFIVPLRRGLRHQLRVTQVRPEAHGVVSVYLTGPRLTELRAEPGQYFRWRFLTPGLWWTANPYSLSAPPDHRGLRITVKALGGHSAALARLRPGTRVWAEGPYGAFTAARRTDTAPCCSPAASASPRCARCSRRSLATWSSSTGRGGWRIWRSAVNWTAWRRPGAPVSTMRSARSRGARCR
jgi:predicted ferric reductase